MSVFMWEKNFEFSKMSTRQNSHSAHHRLVYHRRKVAGKSLPSVLLLMYSNSCGLSPPKPVAAGYLYLTSCGEGYPSICVKIKFKKRRK